MRTDPDFKRELATMARNFHAKVEEFLSDEPGELVAVNLVVTGNKLTVGGRRYSKETSTRIQYVSSFPLDESKAG